MMLPAAISQLWARTLPGMVVVTAVSAVLSGYVGLLVSYHLRFASGPTIILTASLIYCTSLIVASVRGHSTLHQTPESGGLTDKENFLEYKSTLLALAGTVALTMGSMAVASAETINAVASFTILADVVKNVGGDHVNVTSLVPVNGDPHDFEPSPEDAKALKAAAVTFLSGEGLETWFQRLAKAAGNEKEPVVVSRGHQDAHARRRRQDRYRPACMEFHSQRAGVDRQHRESACRGRSGRYGCLCRQCQELYRQAEGRGCRHSQAHRGGCQRQAEGCDEPRRIRLLLRGLWAFRSKRKPRPSMSRS